MKKAIIIFITFLCLLSCNKKGEYKYLVEEKIVTIGGDYRLILSDINDRYLHSLFVGKYTYEKLNPGDTLIIKYE